MASQQLIGLSPELLRAAGNYGTDSRTPPSIFIATLWNRFFPGWQTYSRYPDAPDLRPYYRVICDNPADRTLARDIAPSFLRVDIPGGNDDSDISRHLFKVQRRSRPVADVAASTGRSPEQVDADIEAHKLLGWRDQLGMRWLPSAQFDSWGEPLIDLARVLKRAYEVLDDDDQVVVAWMTEAHPALGERNPLLALRLGLGSDVVAVLEYADAPGM